MLTITGSIWMLAGTILIAGGNIAKEVLATRMQTSGNVYQDSVYGGYALMVIGFLLTLLGFWEALVRRAAPHGGRD